MSEAMVSEFLAYSADIRRSAVSDADWNDKMRAVLGRLVDATVRQASSALVPIDLDLSTISDGELADRMQMHVQSRSGGLQVASNTRLPNSAWCMMLEASKRLRSLPNWGPPRPMAEAPRDENLEILGVRSSGRFSIYRWDDDRYNVKPRPFWRSFTLGTTRSRQDPPVGWWPLPERA